MALVAQVTYTDRRGAGQMARSSATTGVRTNADNQAPKFEEGASTFRVVMEDAEAAEAEADATVTTDNVGLPIRATDVNGDALTYTLGGPDAANFQVRVTVDANNAGPGHAQLEVSAGAALDHETKPRLTVTLTANDGSGASNSTAMITVTIYVTDADEAPTISDRADTTAKGEQTFEYAENRTGPVGTFMVKGPGGRQPHHLVSDRCCCYRRCRHTEDIADIDDFKIDQNGVLSFTAPPDFEAACRRTAPTMTTR